MISNAHVHSQTSVASLNAGNETNFNAQQTENINAQNDEKLDQYHTALESMSLHIQLLSQRSYTGGYKGL